MPPHRAGLHAEAGGRSVCWEQQTSAHKYLEDAPSLRVPALGQVSTWVLNLAYFPAVTPYMQAFHAALPSEQTQAGNCSPS